MDPSGNLTPAASAARGGTIALYITGAGAVSPAIANGAAPPADAAPSQLPAPAQRPAVTIGGAPATVVFSGVPAGVVGVVQINVQVPATAPTGPQAVVVGIGGIASPPAILTVTP
jgi:uncharacterized protein (TIGR03437 family)